MVSQLWSYAEARGEQMEMVLDGFSKLGESLGGKLRPGRICKGAVLGGLRPPALNSAHYDKRITSGEVVLFLGAAEPVTLEPQFVA